MITEAEGLRDEGGFKRGGLLILQRIGEVKIRPVANFVFLIANVLKYLQASFNVALCRIDINYFHQIPLFHKFTFASVY